MRLTAANLSKHRAFLTGENRAANAKQSWAHRDSWLLQLEDDRGNRGIGEASPLPGYSPDDFKKVGAALDEWTRRASDETTARLEILNLESAQQAVAALPSSLPSARFAVETALLDLLGQRRDLPIHKLLGGEDRELPLATLLTLETTAIGSSAARLLDEGFRHFKIKIGRRQWNAELKSLEQARRALGSSTALRLDANGCLPVAELDTRLAALAMANPEFVEQPVLWPRLGQIDSSPVPLAVDEDMTIPWSEIAPWLETGPATAVVLKPMVLGGALPCLELARRAHSLGLVAVASHLFDGPIALQATAALALAMPNSEVAHGLGRHAGLDGWHGLDHESLLVQGPILTPRQARSGLGVTL